MKQEPLFLQACSGAISEKIPLWVMRQAGRYLPEYREIRAKHSFLEVCKTPELACELTLQPIRRFGFDAAIIFSDIMTPLESMGFELEFDPGPVIGNPIKSVADVDKMRVPEGDKIASFAVEAVRMTAQALGEKTPLIGFAGAPLTLASYLLEGGGSKDFAKIRAFIAAEPEAAERLLLKLGDAMGAYLRAQVKAGARAVQLFDSWAGILSEPVYRRFALPAVQRVFAALSDLKVPLIYFAQDAAALDKSVSEVHASVFGIDWRRPVDVARATMKKGCVLQGNLDPACLLASPETVIRETRRVLREGATGPYIFNLGHGILQSTPIASVEAMIETVRQFKRS